MEKAFFSRRPIELDKSDGEAPFRALQVTSIPHIEFTTSF